MKTNYTDLAEFHAARSKARSARDQARHQLSARWALITDPGTRGALLKDAVGDMLRSWSPYRRVHDLLNGRVTGSTVAAVGMAVASAQHGMGRRLLFSGLSMALGKVIGDKRPEGEGLLSSVASAVGRGVRFIHERRAARQEREQDDASTEDRP
jgi:hypothetical protein